jgi:hypothetical protein
MTNILDARRKTHGEWNRNSACSQGLKSVMRIWKSPVNWTPSQNEALDNLAQKTSRIVCGDPNFVDHWVDMARYCDLVVSEIKAMKQESVIQVGRTLPTEYVYDLEGKIIGYRTTGYIKL